MGCSHHFPSPSQHGLPQLQNTTGSSAHPANSSPWPLLHVQFGCVVLTETLAVLYVGTGKHCSKCTTAVCYLQHRSQTTFQTAPQLLALISIEFTCSALKNTFLFSWPLLSPLPPRDKGGLSSKEDRHGYQQPTKSAWSHANNSSDLGGSQNKITSYLTPSMGIWLVGRTLNMARQKYLHYTQENLACTQKNNPTVNSQK